MSEELSAWIGRAREITDEVCAPLMRRMAALLDQECAVLAPGAPVPGHWLPALFDDAAPQSRLGPDGHPAKGEFLPPVPLPRRMLGGRRVTFHAPPRIGAVLTRRSEIAAVTPKEGRSGKLVFVTVRHSVTGPEGVVAVEEQDIAYREAGSGGTPAPAAEMPAPAWTRPFNPDAVMLFRYSAITFNGHRIHYDADYAREAEHYPALVVNGGLTTLMLLEAGLAETSGRLRRYAARTLRPLFCGRAARLCGVAPDGEGRALLWAEDDSGAAALRIEAEFDHA